MVPLVLSAARTLLALQAAVTGTVRDRETGGPLPGALVTLPDLDRAVATDAAGRYALRDVPAGPQHVTVRFIGYAPRSLHALVPPGGGLEINVALSPQPIRLDPQMVPAPVSVRGTRGDDATAFPDRGSSMAAVWQHPLLAEPDVLQALGGGEVVLRPESPGGVHVRGGATDHTAYALDGIPVLSPYHAAGLFSAWNPDALAGVRLASAAPSPEHAPALSGTVEGFTRVPGNHHRAQGSMGTTQARITLDGPVGPGGAGYVVSLRSGFPGVIAPRDEASYVRGETGDWLAKLEAPLLGGRVRLIGYESQNEIDAAALAPAEDGSSPDAGRNVFEWQSRSVGAEWSRTTAAGALRLRAWSAAGHAASQWAAQAGPVVLGARRRDAGILAAVERYSPLGGGRSVAGLRIEQSTTRYRVSSGAAAFEHRARTPVPSGFVEHSRTAFGVLDVTLAAALAHADGAPRLGPRVGLRWRPSTRLAVSATFARTHQFTQSLRNAESVVGTVFPVDLSVGAAGPGVPVARSDQGVVAAGFRPSAGVRFGAQAYARGFDGLLLVAPREGEPFATRAFVVGRGTARGASFDAGVSGTRLGIVASYGLQRVRLAYADSTYVPEHGTTHLVEAGLIVFPTATTSLRLGAASAWGRRATAVSGGFEWEACNLLDQGCEFAGSPHHAGATLGGTSLPLYLRVDVGVRKHWHVSLAGRDAMIALFGTVTNVLGRKNVLTYAPDPVSGRPAPVEMRPLAPLVVGLDWRF